jgi:hypothetical protein
VTKGWILLGLFLVPVPPQADPGDYRARIAPFLQRHCLACHGAEKQKSGVRFDRLDGFRPDQSHLWTKVHEQISRGDMPPKDRPRLSDEERRGVLGWVEKEQRARRGGGTRRLNRREYSAALQDLTGLAVDYAAALPGDGTLEGFDTGADALQDAADSVDRSLQIARRAVDALRFLEPAPRTPLSIDFREVKDVRKAFDAWKAAGISTGDRGIGLPGMGVLLEPRWVGDRGGFTIHVPPSADRRGVLRLKLSVAALKPHAGVPFPILRVEVGRNVLEYREIDSPQERIYEVQIEDVAIESKGVAVTLDNRVEVPYAIEGFPNEDQGKPGEEIPGGTGLFRPVFDRKKLPPEKQPVPYIVLQSLEIDPDYVAAWPPAEWRTDVAELGDDPASAGRLLRLWTERAFRRPVGADEHAKTLAVYEKLRGQRRSFDEALRGAFQSVLMSGPFRYLPATSDAVASRLAFLLTGAPPDAELRRLVPRLRDPAVLDAQVDRLLSDVRSSAFFRPFTTQWLELGQPITIAMDHLQKQDFRFARHLKASMTEETISYVAELVAGNRPARELVASDWTMMNQILSIHYGYPGIEGGRMRKVTLRADDPRGGGLLGHAGIQSMLCWMGDNWVIYRGAWTLRHILDDPPPPPPLEVPELNPSDEKNRGKPLKEVLRQHQENPACAVCHVHMDPLGFAFQNFDLSGRWRTLEHERYEKKELDGKIEWRGLGKSRPVDTLGRLPRGEEFRTFTEWKDLVVRNYQADLVRGLAKNLLIYATGRRPDVADLAEVDALLKELAPRGYPLRDLLKALLRSKAFLGRE